MKKFKRIAALCIAAIMMVTTLGCTGTKNGEDGPTKLTWYIPTLMSGDNKDEVMAKVNALLTEKYNLSLELIGLDSGNFAQKLQVMNAGQEVYDLAFTSHWSNNYFTNVSNGVYYELTEEELKEYAPNTYNSLSVDAWDSVKVDGKIYAVPNWQVQARASAFFAADEFLQATGTDVNSINSIEDVTEYLRKLHQIRPQCNKVPAFWAQMMPYYGMTEVYEENMPGAIKYDKDGKPVVINQFDTDEFKEYAALRRAWVEEGLVVSEYLPDTKANSKTVMEEPFYIHIYKPGGAEEISNSRGYKIQSKQISPSLLTTSGITAAMTGISATSEHPREALKLIEIINTDKEINNLLVYGIEGVDYDKVGENKIKVREDRLYKGAKNWHIGSVANSYLLDTQQDNLWEETKKFNDEAVLSPILGFNANLDDLTLQIANCKTVINEYLELIDLGISSEAKYNEFVAKLKTAGVDEIVTELQKQIDEWWNNK